MSGDFLEEVVAERTGQNPNFPRLVAEAEERRARFRELARRRQALGSGRADRAGRQGVGSEGRVRRGRTAP